VRKASPRRNARGVAADLVAEEDPGARLDGLEEPLERALEADLLQGSETPDHAEEPRRGDEHDFHESGLALSGELAEASTRSGLDRQRRLTAPPGVVLGPPAVDRFDQGLPGDGRRDRNRESPQCHRPKTTPYRVKATVW
jgi:hypothetical protein